MTRPIGKGGNGDAERGWMMKIKASIYVCRCTEDDEFLIIICIIHYHDISIGQ
jgi:hypothetical protein